MQHQASMTRAKTFNSSNLGINSQHQNTRKWHNTDTNTKHLDCNQTRGLQLYFSTVADCPTADTFNITATTSNGSSISFNGSESGTPLDNKPAVPRYIPGDRDRCPTQGLLWPPYLWDQIHVALPSTPTTGLVCSKPR